MISTTTLCRILPAAALLLAACAGSKTMSLDQTDNNKSITLKQGETFEVALKANHTTGYSWGLQDSSGTVVEMYEPARYELDDNPDGKVGVGGVERWTFRAKAPGKQTLLMLYRRAWENTAASETFTVNVTVE